MPSYNFSEPCSGADCRVCGPMPETLEDRFWAGVPSPEETARIMVGFSYESEHELGLHDAEDPKEDCPACARQEQERYAAARAQYDHPQMAPVTPCAVGCRLDEDNPEHAMGCSDYPYDLPF